MILGDDQIPSDALRSVEEVMGKGEKPARFLSKVSESVTAGSAPFLLMKERGPGHTFGEGVIASCDYTTGETHTEKPTGCL
jgi:hypothetical protein